MTDCGLVDEKCAGDQNAAGPESALEFREQRAVEEIYIHDGVERFVREMEVIQVRDNGPDGKLPVTRSRSKKTHRLGGIVNCNDGIPRSRKRERIAPTSRGDIEHDPARNPRQHLDEKRLGLSRRLPAMPLVPVDVSRFVHANRVALSAHQRLTSGTARGRLICRRGSIEGVLVARLDSLGTKSD